MRFMRYRRITDSQLFIYCYRHSFMVFTVRLHCLNSATGDVCMKVVQEDTLNVVNSGVVIVP